MRHLTAAALLILATISTPLASADAAEPAPAPSGKERIISIGGDVTEILVALGLEKEIVGVDSTSKFPKEALDGKPDVGYMRALSAEGVLSLAPTAIFASKSSGPPESVRALKSSSVKFIEIPDDHSPDGILEKISLIANATDHKAEAEKLTTSLKDAFKALENDRSRIAKRQRVLFVLNASGDRMIVGGKGTGAEVALALAGADNAAASITGYKPITPEGLVSMAPDAIVVMSGGRPGDGASQLAKRPAVQMTPAGAPSTPKIREMGGSYLIGFGPRTPDAVRELMTWLYPDIEETKAGGKS